MKPLIILENIRSAYNVGTILRTADALGWHVICSGFTPTPLTEQKVLKSSLGAEKNAYIGSYRNPKDALLAIQRQGYICIASEVHPDAISLQSFQKSCISGNIALIMGSETDGVLPESLDFCSYIVQIDMLGIKESLNVAEAAAIMMRELREKKRL